MQKDEDNRNKEFSNTDGIIPIILCFNAFISSSRHGNCSELFWRFLYSLGIRPILLTQLVFMSLLKPHHLGNFI
jgi:hypothetical protein